MKAIFLIILFEKLNLTIKQNLKQIKIKQKFKIFLIFYFEIKIELLDLAL